ncbi:phage replisome organizer N-terminal domain-containing protein [Gemella morbillorum]|uniref:phage replisome organizer N-terminal domain-containing protein n=1 Tax=Gemella morbillorum TaxID=29391 RepID=UPI00248D7030|nr:phage replisome organizer N-terminal domain-containing protein [Gemella morbillorum]
MSKNKNERTKYWYFRFTKDFFRDKAIRNLKKIPGWGYQYGWIYLEMCSLCLEDGDYILRIPKFSSEDSYITYIAGEINESATAVQQAISYFVSHGFLEIYESETEINVNFPKMSNNLGKSSKEADRIRRIEKENRKLLENKKDSIFSKF